MSSDYVLLSNSQSVYNLIWFPMLEQKLLIVSY